MKSKIFTPDTGLGCGLLNPHTFLPSGSIINRDPSETFASEVVVWALRAFPQFDDFALYNRNDLFMDISLNGKGMKICYIKTCCTFL